MADMMDTLKGLLGDNADEKLNGILGILNSDKPAAGSEASSAPHDTAEQNTSAPDPSGLPVSPEMLLQAQQLMSRISSTGDDNRANLLKSLKPFMRESRRDTIDEAIKFMNLAQITKLFGGE
ncbi:MAG: hypothetical protein ACI38A_03750 [Candidatus Ornithomonoglobus sp.]